MYQGIVRMNGRIIYTGNYTSRYEAENLIKTWLVMNCSIMDVDAIQVEISEIRQSLYTGLA